MDIYDLKNSKNKRSGLVTTVLNVLAKKYMQRLLLLLILFILSETIIGIITTIKYFINL